MYHLRCYRLVVIGPPQSGKGTWSRIIKAVMEKKLLLDYLSQNFVVDLIENFDFEEKENLRKPLFPSLEATGKTELLSGSHNLDLRVFSTGDLLREQIGRKTKLGKEAAAYVQKGGLVPDDLVNKVIISKLSQLGYERFLMDGYPRTVDQARMLFDHAHNYDTRAHLGERGAKSPLIRYHEIDLVISIDCPDITIFKRIMGRRTCPQCGRVYNVNIPQSRPKRDEICDDDGTRLTIREDDREETVEKRLKIYKDNFRDIDNLVQRRGIPKLSLPGEGVARELPEKHSQMPVNQMMVYYLCRMLDFPEPLAVKLSKQIYLSLYSGQES